MPLFLAPSSKKYLLQYFHCNEPLKFARLALSCLERNCSPLQAAPCVLADDFLDFYYSSIEQYFTERSGLIYCAAALDKDKVYKVGLTAKSSQDREKSLKTAGILVGLKVVKQFEVHDRYWAEALIHRRLAAYRLEREFFNINHETLFEIVQRCVEEDKQRFQAAQALCP